MNKNDIKKEIVRTAKRLKKMGFMPGSSGNISFRYNDIIYITPTGINKENLKIEDISEINMDGRILNSITPSSEYLLHLEVYKKRADISSITHTHPPYTIAFSVSNTKPNFNLTAEFKFLVKKIAFCKFKQPASLELAKEVSKNSLKSDVLVLINHGVVILSDSFEKSIILTEEVENFFKINFLVSLFRC